MSQRQSKNGFSDSFSGFGADHPLNLLLEGVTAASEAWGALPRWGGGVVKELWVLAKLTLRMEGQGFFTVFFSNL